MAYRFTHQPTWGADGKLASEGPGKTAAEIAAEEEGPAESAKPAPTGATETQPTPTGAKKRKKTWQGSPPTAGGGSDGGGHGGGFGGANFYDAPSPFDFGAFVPPGFDAPVFNAPAPFAYDDFAAPPTNFEKSPGYDFRLREGQRAIENSASAQGLLRSGNTWKGLIDYNQGMASQEYGDVYNRRFNEWSANRGAAAEDYDRNWRNLLSQYALDYTSEMDEYNRALQSYDANFRTAATGHGFLLDAASGNLSGRAAAQGLALNRQNSERDFLLGLYDISRPNFQFTPSG